MRRPLPGGRVVAVVSTKGGVGKTTVTAHLGHVFAAAREDRVVALDADRNGGSLAYRIPRETRATIGDLLVALARCDGLAYAEVRRCTSRAASGLEVIATPNDPCRAGLLGAREYGEALMLLRRHYALVLVDCAAGVLDQLTRCVVAAADQLVLVASPAIDMARAAGFGVRWLAANGYAGLAENAVLVLNGAPLRSGLVNLAEMERHFAEQVREVVRIPWDPHLELGAHTAVESLEPATREAFEQLAAAVADGFSATASGFEETCGERCGEHL